MSAVWELNEADAFEVSKLLRTRHGRSYSAKTTGILLSRLAQKGYLHFTVTSPAGRGRPAYVYRPVLSRDEAVSSQFANFLSDHLLEGHDFDTLRALLSQEDSKTS